MARLGNRNYLTNNLEKMDYPRYRKQGLPVSSAPVESVINSSAHVVNYVKIEVQLADTHRGIWRQNHAEFPNRRLVGRAKVL